MGSQMGGLMPTIRRADYKDEYRYDWPMCRKAIANGPAHIVLNVDKESVKKKGAKEDAKHPY